MQTEFDVVGAVAAGVSDRAAAWRFVEAFAASWAVPLGVDDGYTDPDLDEAEARMGVRLPTAVREAYQLFGLRSDLTDNQDRLRALEELEVWEASLLLFRDENQGCEAWGIPVEELGQPDPPVEVIEGEHSRWADRFSLACVEMVLFEALWADQNRRYSSAIPAGAIDLVEERFTRLFLPPFPADAPVERARVWFGGHDVIVCVRSAARIDFAARTDEALKRSVALLPAEWAGLP